MIISSLLRIVGGTAQAAILGGVGWTAINVIQIPTINTKLDDHTKSIETVTGDLKTYSEKQQNFREQVIKEVGDIKNKITAIEGESTAHTNQLNQQALSTNALTSAVNQVSHEAQDAVNEATKQASQANDKLKVQVDATSALAATVNQTNQEIKTLNDKVDKLGDRLGTDENRHLFPNGNMR